MLPWVHRWTQSTPNPLRNLQFSGVVSRWHIAPQTHSYTDDMISRAGQKTECKTNVNSRGWTTETKWGLFSLLRATAAEKFPQMEGTEVTESSIKLLQNHAAKWYGGHRQTHACIQCPHTNPTLPLQDQFPPSHIRGSVCVGWLEGPLLLTWSTSCSAYVFLRRPIFSQHDRI